jgi:5-methylcytosine-specific restriction endonuclease McrA
MRAPLHPCGRCGRLIRESCERCSRTRSAHVRGYTKRWQHYRRWWLSVHPCCGDRSDGLPLTGDSACRAAGLSNAGTSTRALHVDHIEPVRGADDARFYDETNHQTLCRRCHSEKTRREQGR